MHCRPIQSFRPFVSLLVLLAAVMLFLAGCDKGKKPLMVSGKISYKGKPLGGGTIKFHSSMEGAGVVPGNIKPDGTFSFGAPAGQSRITIETESVRDVARKGGNYMKMPGAKIPEGMKVSDSPDPTYVSIPKKYADPNTSGLTWDVNSTNKTKDFDLTD
jgi:hypothetical protein